MTIRKILSKLGLAVALGVSAVSAKVVVSRAHSLKPQGVNVMRSLFRVALAAALSVATLSAQAAPLPANFSVVVIGCDTPFIVNSPVPVSVQTSCSANSSVVGTAAGKASATFGGVGGRSASATTSGTDVPIQISSNAVFTDTLTFTKTNPNAPDQFPVSLNLAFGGVVNSAAVFGLASASVGVIVGFLGTSNLEIVHSGSGTFTVSNPQGLGGTSAIAPGAGGFSTVLTTQQQLASVGDIFFSLQLLTQVFTSNVASSATADFSNTLEFPSGIDVFTLPNGYTVNAGTYLVNNRFIDPNAQPPNGVPEPSTLVLLGLGLLGAAGFRRRRSSQGKKVTPNEAAPQTDK